MDDYEYSIQLLDNFFSLRKIQRSLTLISDEKITGWEIWLQIEFATYISSAYEDEIKWHREFTILPDGRKEKNRKRFTADFVFRRKGHKLDCYNVIEFKQHPSPKTCFRNMHKDILKIAKAKESSIDMRSFWVVGVHHKSIMSKPEIKEYLDNKFGINREYIYTKYIPNTSFAYTIF